MNNRFKFRVWNKRTEEMLDVRLISYFSTGNICRVEAQNAVGDIKILDDYKTSIEDIELMQCTGIKDKNGKLIYEGDIAKDRWGNIKEVKFRSGCFFWRFEEATYWGSGALEIIGNIYENKELLND